MYDTDETKVNMNFQLNIISWKPQITTQFKIIVEFPQLNHIRKDCHIGLIKIIEKFYNDAKWTHISD